MGYIDLVVTLTVHLTDHFLEKIMDITTFLGAAVRDIEATQAIEFFNAFEASLDPALWLSLVEEESAEVIEALDNLSVNVTPENTTALLKELADLRYVLVGLNAVLITHWQALMAEDSDFAVRLKAADDLVSEISDSKDIKFDMETLQKAYYRVHVSNMSKLGEDGKPVRREDGKILKGPNYAAPDLSDLVVS